jgi:hypothetical protein
LAEATLSHKPFAGSTGRSGDSAAKHHAAKKSHMAGAIADADILI